MIFLSLFINCDLAHLFIHNTITCYLKVEMLSYVGPWQFFFFLVDVFTHFSSCNNNTHLIFEQVQTLFGFGF